MTGHKLFVAATVVACVGAAGVGGYLAVGSGTANSAAASAEVRSGQGSQADGTPARLTTMATQPASSSQPTLLEPRPTSEAPPVAPTSSPSTPVQSPAPAVTELQPVPAETPGPVERPAVAVAEAADAQPVIEEFEVPEDAVVGIRLDNQVSSETSAVEDRVAGRVTRAVTVGTRIVIPAGAELVGYVSAVERGGKVRERARVGIKFTAVIINKVRTPIQTETIYRLGESPRGEAAAKIGGGAVVGTIIGGMIGGKKGAAIGGTAGAAGGTAVVMKGDRNEAAFTAGTSLTVRLTAPVTIRVER